MQKTDNHHGGDHAPLYRLSDRFIDHANSPQNSGPLEVFNAKAKGVGTCGDSVEIFLLVNGRRIREIKHVPNGCAYTTACASAVTVLVRGRSLDEALSVTPEDVANELGGLPEDHRHCAALAVNTLGEAIDDYYQHVWGDANKDMKSGKRK